MVRHCVFCDAVYGELVCAVALWCSAVVFV